MPQPKQQEFLQSIADIALFGGAAGSGKSFSILLDFASDRFLCNPNYGGVIFRRTYPEITNEGGLWDEAGLLYPQLGGVPNESKLRWNFPGGATVRFSHLQHEKDIYRWKGAQVARIGFDEVTHFSKKQFFYLLSRMRSMHGIHPQMRATCNPDAESWLAEFIDWWINSFGYPDPDRCGVIRWFIVHRGKVIWGDSREELEYLYPDCHPKSFTFISAKLTDNPALLLKDPGYRANLEAQDEVERSRLLDGNWKVRKSEARLFNSEAIDLAAIGSWELPQPNKKYLVCCDPNFGGDDFFEVIVLEITQKTASFRYLAKVVHHWRSQNTSVIASIDQLSKIIQQYNPVLTAIESNSGGRIILERMIEKLPQYRFEGVITTAASKIVNTDRVAIALEEGLLIYPEDWEVGMSQLKSFGKITREALSGKDDIVMALAAGLAWLDEARLIRQIRRAIGSVNYA